MENNNFIERYNKLNDEQKLAVDTIDGPVLVIAGPGSGKTELLSLRIANILRSDMITPNQILCLTFTDSGAANMRNRLLQIIGNDAHKVAVYTFHSFAARIMEEYKEEFYNANDYKVATEITKSEILDNIFRSLPHDNALSSFHTEFGFSYFKSVKDRISLIKKAGFDAKTYKELANRDQDNLLLIEKVINDNWTKARLNIKDLIFVKNIINELSNINDSIYAQIYKTELTKALDESLELGKTESIRKWKESNLILISQQEFALKEIQNKDKIETVAYIYEEYEKQMHDIGCYDFDDMIIQLNSALNNNSNLLANLAEQYQYIMIDEFQDTSDAQLNIVYNICNHRVNEGRPNICVVGDDDQSIYKFQGAEINNIINFRYKYKDVRTITLKYNYRSTQNIIDLSHNIAEQSSERLTHKYKDINKKMQSHADAAIGNIITTTFENKEEQYAHTVKEIQNLLKNNDGLTNNNVDKKIAIIARNNDSLRNVANHLNAAGIQYEFIYKDNILNMPFIIDILNILKYIQAIYDNNTVNKDDILIKIIKAPYWNVERSDIFELSYIVKSQNINWLEAIKNYKSTTQIYNCILEISDKLEKTNLSNLIHSIINISEFKKYYFDKKNKDNYYKCLEALRALYEAIEEYDTDDIFTFLKIYEKYNLPILITAPTNTESNVTLLTAHRAKGLEFDIVFIIDTDDKIWKKNNRPNIAPVPKYLKQLLSPIDEDDNDNIRLLFVAASRAKTQLYVYAVEHMSRYLPTEHITNTNLLNVNIKNGLSEIDKIIAIENSLIKYDYNLDEINILKQLLHNYQMSPTHFNNFLRKNGPQYFLEVNLLRFPQPLDITGLYGSAIHSAIEYMVTEYRIKKDKPVLENVLNDFKIKMERHRYDKVEINKQINRGLKVIKNYYNNELDKLLKSIDNDGDIEVNLSHEHIIYTGADGGEAHITGKLDFIYIDKVDNSEEGIINVLDWKTGKTLYSWDKGLDINEKEKALRYKYQLMFYKLLLEQSPKYSKYIVGKLGLQFVEDKDIHTLYYEQNQEEYNEFCKLVVDVYQDIINMRF